MKKILIIEDDKDVLTNLEMLLTLSGFTVFAAINGRQGVEYAIINTPDLIISDIMMNGMDGYQVLKEIRENDKISQTPFIFLSAISDPREIKKAIDLGAKDYITKPFRSKSLIEKINQILLN